jgi:hypothetical protein
MAPILAKQVELGELTEEEAKRHPQRNALRSAVIGDKMQHIDASKRPMKFRKGDRLLLASDGLETLSVDEIAALIKEAGEVEAGALAKALIEAVDARQRKGQDNTTVMVIDPYVGGVPAFGVVDPDAVTERVTLRTGPPGSAEEKTIKTAPATAPGKSASKPKSGAGRALLMALLFVAGAFAVVTFVFPKFVDDLLSRGGGGTTATTAATTAAATTGATTAPGTSGTTGRPATTGTPGTARPDTKPPVGGETSGREGTTAGGRPGTGDGPSGSTGGASGSDTGAGETPGGGSTLPQPGGSSTGPGGKATPSPSGGASGASGGGDSRKN